MAYELKTKATAADPHAFIAAAEPERRRRDAQALCAMLEAVTGQAPQMWGGSIVGFGTYDYTYASGHSGRMCRIGFAPRKTSLVLYLPQAVTGDDARMAPVGPVKRGKGCVYVSDLSKLDPGGLREVLAAAWAHRGGGEERG